MIINKNKYNAIILIIFVIGFVFRTYLYLDNPSFWADEAGLGINIINKSYLELFKGLDNLQACPVGFLVLTKSLLDLFKTNNFFYRDLILRFVPYLSGMLSLPLFYYLCKLIFNDNKIKILTAFGFISLAKLPIIYSAQYKQYSTEMLISVLLLIVFYKLLIKNSLKIYYYIIIAIAPWFSFSSLFIITSGYIALFIKDKKQFFKGLIVPLLSMGILYLISLRFVFASTYNDMTNFWQNCYAFFSFNHPLRPFFRFGDLYASDKYMTLVLGFIIIYAWVRYCFCKKDLFLRILMILPFILLIIASFLHKYPASCRLLLFIMPISAIVISELSTKFDKILKIIFIILFIISCPFYNIHCKEINYSYARDIIPVLLNKINSNDIIIFDSPSLEYIYNLKKGELTNKILYIPVGCINEYLTECKDFINKLPSGEYYFLSNSYNGKDIVKNNPSAVIINDIDVGFIPKFEKITHFNIEHN